MTIDLNDDDEPFTPETLEGYAKRAEDLRAEFVFGTDYVGADPFAEQHYLAALAYLELAQRSFSLARLCQVRALGGGK